MFSLVFQANEFFSSNFLRQTTKDKMSQSGSRDVMNSSVLTLCPFSLWHCLPLSILHPSPCSPLIMFNSPPALFRLTSPCVIPLSAPCFRPVIITPTLHRGGVWIQLGPDIQPRVRPSSVPSGSVQHPATPAVLQTPLCFVLHNVGSFRVTSWAGTQRRAANWRLVNAAQ